MTKLYLVTHTQSTHHVDGLVGGWYDASLTDRGQSEARAVAQELKRRLAHTPVLFSSDLRRAVQTAEPIAALLGCPLETTTDLREVSCGVAEGGPQVWLDEHIVLPPRHDGRMDHRICDGAESRREAATRIYAFMDRLMDKLPAETVVVTHGFAATFVVSAWIGMPLEATAHVGFALRPGSLSMLQYDDTWGNRTVTSLGDVQHLAAGE